MRGEVERLEGMKDGGVAVEDSRRDERRLCFACRLRAGARREKERRNGVWLVTWRRRLSGEELPRRGNAPY